MPMNIDGLSPYPDFFAFAITLLITGLLTVGVKESSRMNNIFTAVNLLVLVFVLACGSIKVDSNNWSIKPEQVSFYLIINTVFLNLIIIFLKFPSNCIEYANHTSTNSSTKYIECGKGGFFPFGFVGMIAGAAKCFYAFVGFDCIATTG